MKNKKLKAEYTSLQDLNTLVTTYEEIAALRMRKVKNTVLLNRTFLSDLNNIYAHVRVTYNNELRTINIKKRLHLTDKIHKEVCIYISANTGLYGDIMRHTFEEFKAYVSKGNKDIIIVGKLGKNMWETEGGRKDITYYDLSDGVVSSEMLRSIMNEAVKYEDITVFHGYFNSILKQTPAHTKVTGELREQGVVNTEKERLFGKVAPKAQEIFEPSIDEIVQFFETQLLASIFEQSFYESSLSKFASRMLTLDYAVSRISTRLKQANFKIRKSHHNNFNKQQMTLMSSISSMKGV